MPLSLIKIAAFVHRNNSGDEMRQLDISAANINNAIIK